MPNRHLVFLLVAAFAQGSVAAQELRDDLVLGLGDLHETEDFYRSIGSVTTDARGRIFVSEYHGGDVRVYAEDGTYLRTLGSRGEAPGEFRVINALAISEEGRLVVLDQINHRFTWYAPDLESFEVTRAPGEVQINAESMLRLSTTEVLLPYSTYGREGPETLDAGLFHVFSSTLDRRTESFGTVEDFDPKDEMAAAHLRSKLPGQPPPLLLSPDSILVSEEYHPGHLTLFERNDEGWQKAGIWRGTDVVRPYRLLEQPNVITEEVFLEMPYEAIRTAWSGPGGAWWVDVWSASRGLAHGLDGNVLHFAYTFDGVRGSYRVEEFTRNGTLVADHRLQVSPKGEHTVELLSARLKHQDGKGRLYFSHSVDGVPAVRRMTFAR